MKKFLPFIVTILILTMLSGCSIGNNVQNAERRFVQAMHQNTSEPALSRDEAASVALRYVGLTQEKVSRLHTEFELDDGVARYDVEFTQGQWEYEFEIDAQSGEILSFDKDPR